MGYPMKDAADPDVPSGSGRSLACGLLVGCGVLMLLGCALACGGVIFLGWKGYSQVDKFAREFEQRGYARVQGQVVDVTKPVSSDTVYVAQVLKIKADVHGNLAIMAQVVEIEATVDGDIDFLGQVLVVKKTGVVKGDIRARAAQVIDVQGTVEGKITGAYQALQKPTAR